MDDTCEVCGGSGQIGHFPGVSRFMICWEECPECLGSGLRGFGDSTEQSEHRPPFQNTKKDDDDRQS